MVQINVLSIRMLTMEAARRSKSDGGWARGGPFVCPHPSVSNTNGLRIIAIWSKRKWPRRGIFMATPGQLVKCIAEALSIPEASVVQYDRLLAENGLRSKGGPRWTRAI